MTIGVYEVFRIAQEVPIEPRIVYLIQQDLMFLLRISSGFRRVWNNLQFIAKYTLLIRRRSKIYTGSSNDKSSHDA